MFMYLACPMPCSGGADVQLSLVDSLSRAPIAALGRCGVIPPSCRSPCYGTRSDEGGGHLISVPSNLPRHTGVVYSHRFNHSPSGVGF